MSLRPTQSANFDQISAGIRRNLLALVRAQEQVSTGKRILRPSDDGVGTAISMSLTRQRSGVEAHLTGVHSVQPVMATSTMELESASDLLAEARSLVLQALNGTMAPSDRAAIADQIDQISDAVLEVANTRFGDRYLFGGTETAKPPFVEDNQTQESYVSYRGNNNQQRIRIGKGTTVDLNLPGNQIFGGDQFESLGFSGQTGLKAGDDASSGSGYMRLYTRTASVTGANVAGIAMSTAGGTTILGSHQLAVDGANRTVRLGNGPTKQIPTPAPNNLTLLDGDGSIAVIDFTGWTGAFVTTTLVGQGEISTDNQTWQPMDVFSSNVEVHDATTGNLLHLNARDTRKAGQELVVFKGATNLFDSLRGISADLRAMDDGDNTPEMARLNLRFEELIDGHERLLSGLGKLGSRHQRLNSTESRLQDLSTQLAGLVSEATDVDISQAVLDLQQAEQTLQLTQATGARLMQQSLLNYLG
ncbi:MAG: flagellar hook-associated protein FlgL [Planctomycetota bacterium]